MNQELLALSVIPLSTLITLVFGHYMVPLLARLKMGQHIREEGPESHKAKQGTPTMGGLMFLIPACVATLLFARANLHTVILLLIVVLTTGLGFIDDFQKVWYKNNKGISPKQKLLGQIILGLFLGAYMLWGYPQLAPVTELPFTDIAVSLHPLLYIPFIVLFFTATTNAVNLTDGLDGLATHISIVVLSVLCVMLWKQGALEHLHHNSALILGLATIGGCIGFLWFNSHPAAVFMGDTGSIGLGGVIAVLVVSGHLELWFVLVGLIFVLEALSVIIQVLYFKRTGGKRFFRMSPLHHHFELGGWKETQVVQRFTIVSVLIGFFALIGYEISHFL